MDLLKQCQQWFEQEEEQKVIDALEAIPAEERTPELDSELAKAYIAVAHIGEREPFEKALELLAPHEEYFAEDHCWNYRIASAYYYLDEEGPALRYFEKALEARPGDKDTKEYIDDCRRRLSLPRFEKNFRERTQEAWAAFSQIEAELREIMDTDKTHRRSEELIEKCGNALKTALRDTSFELGFNGEKYELILSPEGFRSRLFPLVYFQKQAPESVLEHWNIWVGRQPCEGFELRAGEIEVRAEDVQMWAEETEDHQVSLVLCCEKLTPILKEDTDKVWWALSMLVDQTIGEVSAIAFVAGFDVYAQPKDEPAKLLSELPELLQSMGLSLWRDGSDYLENSYLAYELEPVEDPEADWRLDVYTGTSRLPVLINDYLTARTDMVDEYHRDGIVAGFICYPLTGFTGEERSKAILDFRDNLRDAILRDAGAEAVTFLGGATGLYCGYLDFIAWDLPAVLTAAQAFFEGSDLPYAHFHVFRRDVGGVPLLDEKELEPDIHEETGSLLSAEDIETLESFDEGTTGYFEKMLGWLEDFIKNGVEEGRFSEKQAHQDLQIALWYAFACLNLDDYIHYYQAAQWMKDSEPNTAGCATWYYRYSVALMYCGRLEEALNYAEKGAKEEPNYPWIWLQVGKLRAHFGDKTGALDAVKQGLKLEPGDYEFLTLKKEIKAGATLEQMEYHWINPDADQTLQQGLDENADDKQRALACIRVDEAGLSEFYALFCPERYGYEKNSPCCEFQYPVKEHLVELSFRMNEAGLSKMGTDWLRQLKERLDNGEWLTHTPEGEPEGILTGVFVDQIRRIGLVYQQPGEDQYFQIFLNPDGTKADAFWSSRKNSEPEVYTEDEMSAIEQHIKNTFGEFENVFHELVSPDIHVDICVVPPSEERDYYTLVTMGMGAHRMNVPEELAEYKLERAELAIALQTDWKLDEESLKDERWYWPIGLLKVLARLPISSDTWLGFGHTMDKQSPFAEDTKLCAAILTGPQGVAEGGEVCTLPGGEEVNFYQVIPLYRNEMEYKIEHDVDALLNKMAGISFVVNPTRQNAITRGTLAEEEFTGDMDDAARHLKSIQEKGLPVDELSAYNHMAIYLRWCMEHDLMSAEFMERYWEQVQPFIADVSRADLRSFIRDQLKGQLFGALFNKEGAAFAGYYYGEADSPYFPSDIDNYALDYFGLEQYYSDKFQDEAYLFIPFDENYYQAMAKVIEKRFVNWQGQNFDEATLEPSDLAEAMMEYLDCECTYFPSMTDDDPIMSAYNYAKRESVKEGFVPVLIKADDEILWECLIMNSDPDSDGEDDYAFDPDKVAAYRKKMLSAPIKNSKAVLEEMIGQRKEEAEDDDMDWDEEILGEMEGGYDNRRFSSYWNSDNNMTYPLILAKIPVKNPWEIFAYLPFGGWNECPNTPELMAVAKYWFEQHGAVPAAMSHDELEFLLPAPVPEEKAMDAAVELYGFCPDVIDQGPEEATVGALSDVLRQSTVWYFWWD
ncbi:suppressor of fused domain protein [Anaeromassilibacillus sp. SJQ-5]